MSGEGAMQYSQSSRPAAAAQCRLASRFTPVEKQCGTAVHSRSDDATSSEICACTPHRVTPSRGEESQGHGQRTCLHTVRPPHIAMSGCSLLSPAACSRANSNIVHLTARFLLALSEECSPGAGNHRATYSPSPQAMGMSVAAQSSA